MKKYSLCKEPPLDYCNIPLSTGRGKGFFRLGSKFLEALDDEGRLETGSNRVQKPHASVWENPTGLEVSLHIVSSCPLGCSVTSEGRVGERGAAS